MASRRGAGGGAASGGARIGAGRAAERPAARAARLRRPAPGVERQPGDEPQVLRRVQRRERVGLAQRQAQLGAEAVAADRRRAPLRTAWNASRSVIGSGVKPRRTA